MTNLVSGGLHEAYRFTRANLAGLFQVSFLPLVASVTVSVMYVLMLIPLFNSIPKLLKAAEAENFDAMQEFIMKIAGAEGLMFAASIVSMFFLAYLAVRVVRYFVRGETGWLILNKDIGWATAYWALYSFGIYMLATISLVVVMIPMFIVIGAASAMLYHTDFGFLTALIIFVSFALFMGVIIATLFAVALRFASGLPVVALGEKPDFFGDMWKQSKGYTMALAWRAMGIYLALMVVNLIVLGIALAGPIVRFAEAAQTLDFDKKPQLMFSYLGDFLMPMVGAQLIMIVISVPVMWLGIIWLTIINKRFFDARRQVS